MHLFDSFNYDDFEEENTSFNYDFDESKDKEIEEEVLIESNHSKTNRKLKQLERLLALKILNSHYPEGEPINDLDRLTNAELMHVRSVFNAGEKIICEETENSNDELPVIDVISDDLKNKIIEDYINGAKMQTLTRKYYGLTENRIRNLLKSANVYVKNRYLYILTPVDKSLEEKMYDTINSTCNELGISPSRIDQVLDREFKGYLVKRIDQVQIQIKKRKF